MAGVIQKFIITSMLMWAAPVAILYGFNHNFFPGELVTIKCCIDGGKEPPLISIGSTQLSPYTMTLLSGFLAVISVNVVIALYIYMAMKEPSYKHEPDPKFLAEAKASIRQSEPTEAEDLSTRTKQE